ncbi:hypothetical protein Gotur_023469 [Gossypium turneri]
MVALCSRTLQTAVGVFGGDGYTDRMDVVPLMVANAGNSGRAAISSLNCPPIVAVELCREHLGVHPCDKRRNISEYQFLFPAIESDEDTWWKADVRETKEEVAARGQKFLNCTDSQASLYSLHRLWTRKEKEIAIVTHSGFLFHTLSALGNDCHPLVKKEICKQVRFPKRTLTIRLVTSVAPNARGFWSSNLFNWMSLAVLAFEQAKNLLLHLVTFDARIPDKLLFMLLVFLTNSGYTRKHCKAWRCYLSPQEITLLPCTCSFANCELRSMVIVDRSMIGFDPSMTNYPGKTPSGLDLPSDVVDEKAD